MFVVINKELNEVVGKSKTYDEAEDLMLKQESDDRKNGWDVPDFYKIEEVTNFDLEILQKWESENIINCAKSLQCNANEEEVNHNEQKVLEFLRELHRNIPILNFAMQQLEKQIKK